MNLLEIPKWKYLLLPAVTAALAFAFNARAQETGMTGAQYTEVVDAFDVDDPYDFHLSVSYEHTRKKSEVSRECMGSDCVDSRINDFIYYEKALESKDLWHTLRITALFGIFHDIHLKLELPIILQRSSSLKVHPDIETAQAERILRDPVTDEQIFNIPFTSTNRSGIDYFVTGLEWGILNQARNPSWPNWNIYIDGLWGVGKIMKPSGHTDDEKLGAEATGGDEGISRGNLALRVGTRIGKRFKYINPYFGFEALLEFPKREAPYPFGNSTVYDGQVNSKPPMRGTMHFGLEVIPWEKPATQQKFFIDLRFIGGYVSEGRDYSVLYDALGTSKDPSLNYFKGSEDFWEEEVGASDFASQWNMNYGDGDELQWDPATESYDYRDSGREYDYYKKETWTGLTDIENYGTFGGRFTLGFITGKWFKIMAGVGIAYNQPHFITFADQCNSGTFENKDSSWDPAWGDSNCTMFSHGSGTSSFNPDYRAILDEPGNRFKISSTLIFDVFVHAVALF